VQQLLVVTIYNTSLELFLVSWVLQLFVGAGFFGLLGQTMHFPMQKLNLVLNDLRVFEATPIDHLNAFVHDKGVSWVANFEQSSLLHKQLPVIRPAEHR